MLRLFHMDKIESIVLVLVRTHATAKILGAVLTETPTHFCIKSSGAMNVKNGQVWVQMFWQKGYYRTTLDAAVYRPRCIARAGGDIHPISLDCGRSDAKVGDGRRLLIRSPITARSTYRYWGPVLMIPSRRPVHSPISTA
ncbi:hypothetical protein BC628DRAFT_528532 [Trametes gibbosa]|nr:hypothetical protein BC628DRAFT_528532 [Trametes gibbosa]